MFHNEKQFFKEILEILPNIPPDNRINKLDKLYNSFLDIITVNNY